MEIPKENDVINSDSEELKQEEEALEEAKQDDIRNSIIEKYGLDEEDELVDKLVSDQLEQRKAFGKVVAQKRKWREMAGQPNKTETPTEKKPQTTETVDVSELVKKELEQRDLEQLDYPDELKAEIKKIAQVQGLSIRQASKDPYILYKKEQLDSDNKIEDGAASGTRKGSAEISLDKPPKFDMATEEGRKAAREWRKNLKEK